MNRMTMGDKLSVVLDVIYALADSMDSDKTDEFIREIRACLKMSLEASNTEVEHTND